MKLIIVTNAQSNRDIGIEDNSEGLSEIGMIEARQLAMALKKEKLDYVYCSPAFRAEQSMEIILAENPKKDIGIAFSRFLQPKTTKEDLLRLKSRVKIFLDELPFDHTDEETILAVTHKKVAEMLVFVLTGDHPVLESSSISVLELSVDGNKILKVNDTAHLG